MVLNGGLKALKFAWLAALGPVGLGIAAVILIGTVMVVAYKKSERFRSGVNTVFKAVARFLLDMVDTWLHGFQMMFNVLGKLPGKAGAPFRAAARSVQGMRNQVNGLRADINRVRGKTVNVRVNTTYAVYGNKGGHYEGGTFVKNRAAGGPTPPGRYVVGEHRPEMLEIDGQGGARVSSRVPRAVMEQRGAGRTGGSGGNTYVTVHVHTNAVLSNHRDIKAAVVDAFERAPKGTRGLPPAAVRRT